MTRASNLDHKKKKVISKKETRQPGRGERSCWVQVSEHIHPGWSWDNPKCLYCQSHVFGPKVGPEIQEHICSWRCRSQLWGNKEVPFGEDTAVSKISELRSHRESPKIGILYPNVAFQDYRQRSKEHSMFPLLRTATVELSLLRPPAPKGHSEKLQKLTFFPTAYPNMDYFVVAV